MTRTIKSIILGIFLFLTLIMLTPTQVYADGWEDGTGGIGGDVSDDQNIGGVTKYRTGWILTLTGSDGLPILGSKVVFFPYLDNLPVGCSGTIATEFFNVPINDFRLGTPIGAIPCFNGETGGGPVLQAFLRQTPCTLGGDDSYTNNAEYVIDHYLGVPIADLQEYIVDKEAYIQISPQYWARKQGQTKADKREWFVGTSEAWLSNGFPTYIDAFTHRIFPQSCHLIEPWWGLGTLSGYKSAGSYWQDSEWRSNGLGIGGIKCNSNFQVVQVIETPSGNQTRYLTSDSKYTIPDKIGNAVIQPDSGFVSKEHTKTNSASASYSEVKAGCTQIGGLVSGGTFDFLSRQGSTALFLHYKGELPPPETADTDLYSWELSVRIPGEKPGSTTEKRTDMEILHNSFSDMQNRVVAWQDSKVFEYELEKQVEVERSVAKDHDYKLSQDHGQFNIDGGIWQLYRGEYIDKWVYFKDLASTIWTVDDKIDPNYSYYLCRSHLESLGLVIDRGASGTAGLYLSTPNAFVEGYDGVLGKEPQKANTLQTWKGVAPYNYQYVPTWANGTGAWIVVDRFTRQILPHTYESREEKIDYEIQIFYAD